MAIDTIEKRLGMLSMFYQWHHILPMPTPAETVSIRDRHTFISLYADDDVAIVISRTICGTIIVGPRIGLTNLSLRCS